jgi:hypothetical protein
MQYNNQGQSPYDHKFVLFLDILGFKKAIDDKKSDEFATRVLKVFNDIEKKLQQLTVSQFSDTFVISHQTSSVVIQIAFILQRVLLVNKLVSRGVITYGEIYHKGHRFIGPAINEAYNMETKEAIYPRIIIGNNAFNKIRQ